MVVEVADATLTRDRGIKLRSYAKRKNYSPGQSVPVALAGQQFGEFAMGRLF